MRIGNLSPSKLEGSRQCDARLLARLEDEEYEEEHGDGAKAGTLAHAGAKHWFRPGERAETPDEAFKRAMAECEADAFSGGLPSTLGLQDARNMFDLMTSTYNRDVVKIAFAERRYKGTLANGVPVHLIIDLGIDRGINDKGLRVLELVDWKSGYLTCTTDEMYGKDQVLMNLLAVSRDPALADFQVFQFTYQWLRKGHQTGPVELTKEQLSDYEYYLMLEYQRLLNVTEPRETRNSFCKSCGRRYECKSYRTFFSEAMGQLEPLTPEQMQNLAPDEIMAQHSKLKGQIDMLETARSALGDYLKGVMQKSNATEVEGEKFRATLRQNKQDSYAVSTVLAMCAKFNVEPAGLLTASKKEVETRFADKPEAMLQLNATMRHSATAPFIMVSAAGAKKKKKA